MRLLSFEHFLGEARVRKTFADLVRENTYELDDYVYHGTPRHNLHGILESGLYGYDHREMNESNIVCTSLNEHILTLFSNAQYCGLMYHAQRVKIFILPEWLRAILDEQSGLCAYNNYDEYELAKKCQKYGIPFESRGGDAVRLPANYIQKNLPEDYLGTTYEYVANQDYGHRDEAEITFMNERGIAYLNAHIESVFVDGDEFDTAEEALAHLTGKYTVDELNDQRDNYAG